MVRDAWLGGIRALNVFPPAIVSTREHHHQLLLSIVALERQVRENHAERERMRHHAEAVAARGDDSSREDETESEECSQEGLRAEIEHHHDLLVSIVMLQGMVRHPVSLVLFSL